VARNSLRFVRQFLDEAAHPFHNSRSLSKFTLAHFFQESIAQLEFLNGQIWERPGTGTKRYLRHPKKPTENPNDGQGK